MIRQAARAIWNAGVDAVRAQRLVSEQIRYDPERNNFCVNDFDYPLAKANRICIVGGGKAAGYLAQAIEDALLPVSKQIAIDGCVSVPDNCLVPTRFIDLVSGRPANINEPTDAGVLASQDILQRVASLDAEDLCLCLLTGGGSALLPSPVPEISLEQKIQLTRLLSSNGANIRELNRVRIAMSKIKGGGLSRASSARRIVSLVISDVIGDPLDLIASGPTFENRLSKSPTKKSEDDSPIGILRRFVPAHQITSDTWKFFEEQHKQCFETSNDDQENDHHILANNKRAVDAATDLAQRNGYEVVTIPPEPSSMTAEEVAAKLVQQLRDFHLTGSDVGCCFVWGGEPTVKLAPAGKRGRGGRNQQLVLKTIQLWNDLPAEIQNRLCILSAGTDGEDGPTDAAGAFVDQHVVDAVVANGLDVNDHLIRNDAYTLLDKVDALLRTGPTQTNVCDLRVAVVSHR